MAKKEDTLDKLKGIFKKFNLKLSSADALKLAEVNLSSEGKLADGSMIYSETDFTKDQVVYTKDADGNAVPAAPGEYAMEDGSTIIVGDGGMISDVKMKADEPPIEMTAEEILPIVAELGEKLAGTEAELATEKTAHESVKTELAALKVELASLKETNVKLMKKAAGEHKLELKDEKLEVKEKASRRFLNLISESELKK